MPNFKRADRVAELLKKEISQMISTDLKDPLIGMATVSKVRLSDDLRSARIYISVIGSEKQGLESIKGLERALGFIRSELRKRTELRVIPEISFRYDDSIDYAMNIESLLKKAKKD